MYDALWLGDVMYLQWETWQVGFTPLLLSFLRTTVFPPTLQLIENSVCLLRNLSYQVHREIPGCERYQEAQPINQGPAPSSQKGGCFSSRKSKGLCQRKTETCTIHLFRQEEGHLLWCHCWQQCFTRLILNTHTHTCTNKTSFRTGMLTILRLGECSSSCSSLFVFHWEYWFVLSQLQTQLLLFNPFVCVITESFCSDSESVNIHMKKPDIDYPSRYFSFC